MVKVQQQAFPAIEESEPKKIVVDEREPRPDHDIREAEPAMALFDRNLSAHRGITVHVVDVGAQRGIGLMDKCVVQTTCRPIDLDGGMRAMLLKLSSATADEAQLGIRIETAVLDPAAEKEVLAGNPEALQVGW